MTAYLVQKKLWTTFTNLQKPPVLAEKTSKDIFPNSIQKYNNAV